METDIVFANIRWLSINFGVIIADIYYCIILLINFWGGGVLIRPF